MATKHGSIYGFIEVRGGTEWGLGNPSAEYISRDSLITYVLFFLFPLLCPLTRTRSTARAIFQ